MSPLAAVLSAYRTSWSRLTLFVGLYLALQITAYALITPALAGLINLAVSFSNQSALTDQDIARYLLTPGGFVAALAVLSILLLAEVFGIALMAAVLRFDGPDHWQSAKFALSVLFRRLSALLIFAGLFVLRMLALVVPFVLVGLLIAQQLLGQYDINFYLSNQPPEFLLAVGLIGAVVLVMVVVVLVKVSGWAIAMHLVIFDDVHPNAAFAASQRRMTGRRIRFQAEIVIWIVVRLLLAAALGLLATLVLNLVPMSPLGGLRFILTVSLIVVAVWILLQQVLAAISLGALAGVVSGFFDSAVVVQPITAAESRSLRFRLAVVAALFLAVAVGGFWSGGVLIESVKADDSVEIIAHRGAAGSRPENTMASVQQAIDDRADWIEIDVQESADGHVVVMHDSDFMKLSGVDLTIWDATLEDLSQIDIGSWFDPQFADQRPPLLRDVLEASRDKAKVLIELKYYGHDVDLESRVARIVEETRMADQIATMSLKYPAVQKMIKLRPDWRAGVLAATAVGDLSRLEGEFVAISSGAASAGLVRSIRAAGKDLYVWTINDPLEMSKMISMGVDGLITDEPALAHQVLDLRAGLNTAERLVLWLSEELGLTINTKEYRDANP